MTETATGPTPYERATHYERLVLGAFKLAMRQLGIPDHPDGRCPAAECSCAGMADAAEARALQLLTDPDIGDAQPCEDCKVLVPFLANCYGIDCGNVVCVACGQRRGLGDSYKLGPWER
jgi:hypothetical protein